MAYEEMEVAKVKDGGEDTFSFEKTISLSSATNSNWILIPDDIRSIAVTVIPSGGASAKVQTTTDPISIVKSGSGITAVDWDLGEVTVNSQDSAIPVTAMRLVQIGSGASKMTMRAQ